MANNPYLTPPPGAPPAPGGMDPAKMQRQQARTQRQNARAAAPPQAMPMPPAMPMQPPSSGMATMDIPASGLGGPPAAAAPMQQAQPWNPTSMVGASDPMQRAQQMERMARPTPVRNALKSAQATGAVPGMPKPPGAY